MDLDISEGTILKKNCRKMTIEWSFSYNSFVKLNREKTLEATT